MQNIPKELWMQIPADERAELVNHFSIPRTGYTEVHDNIVVSDGYSTEDLRVLTPEAMTEYVGSEINESMLRLWELTVAKAHSIVNPPVGTIKPVVVDDGGDIQIDGAITEHPNVESHAPAKKAGRPAKK